MSDSYTRWMPVVVVALSAALFVFDLFMPLGVANGVLYAGVVLLTSASSSTKAPVLAAFACSILLIIGAFAGPHLDTIPLWVGITNRTLSFLMVWISAILLQQRQRAEIALRRSKSDLEHRVRERTRELADLNQALVDEISERADTERSLRTSEAALASSRQELQHRDLHDDINQRLAMLVVQVESLETGLPRSADDLGKHLRSIQDRLTELSDDVRHLAYQFHPSILDDLGLTVALQRLVDDFSARSGIAATFDCGPSLPLVQQDVSTCLYRVAQECLGNIVKHARASTVHLSLTAAPEGLLLSIEDDGVGFDQNKLASRNGGHGLGLVSMAERVRLVNGTVTIDSAPHRGTRMHFRVPHVEVTA